MKRMLFIGCGLLFLLAAFLGPDTEKMDLIILSWIAFICDRIEELDAGK